MRPGLWKRAGFSGVFTGLDYGAALALADHALDRPTLGRMLMQAEGGLAEALAEETKGDGEG